MRFELLLVKGRRIWWQQSLICRRRVRVLAEPSEFRKAKDNTMVAHWVAELQCACAVW